MKEITKKPIAVFDIDGTIFRGSLLIELDKALVKYGIFPPIVEKEVEDVYSLWVNRKGSYEDYINKVVEIHHSRLSGCSPKDVNKISHLVIKEQKERVYIYTRDLIKQLRKTHLLLAISGSPVEIVKIFSKKWRFDKYFATEHEVINKCYTEKISKLPVADKKKTLLDFIEKNNLSLKNSVGVGDTESDVSFLKIVDRPICFNPNKKLYDYAKREKWQIVAERKDVIYKM